MPLSGTCQDNGAADDGAGERGKADCITDKKTEGSPKATLCYFNGLLPFAPYRGVFGMFPVMDRPNKTIHPRKPAIAANARAMLPQSITGAMVAPFLSRVATLLCQEAPMKKPRATRGGRRVQTESRFGGRPTMPNGVRLTALRPTLSQRVAISVAF
jgi:hypothetical protein